MYDKSAQFYDVLCANAGKNYEHEVNSLHALIEEHKITRGNTLLDVGCGTGMHIRYLKRYYDVEGIDIEPGMLAFAQQHQPDVIFHQGDMVDFNLERQFDVVTCLYSSIGYVKTTFRLQHALRTLSFHALPGGLVILEPWLTPEVYNPGIVSTVLIDKSQPKIVRMTSTSIEGSLSILNIHYLVAKNTDIEYFKERHEMGLFKSEEYLEAFALADLDVLVFLPDGLTGRGLYIGRKKSIQ
mgnify:CR=1 FL=1